LILIQTERLCFSLTSIQIFFDWRIYLSYSLFWLVWNISCFWILF